MEVHVVSKVDNQVHAVATLDRSAYDQPDLDSSSVRVQPLLISLSSNNLSYARGGDLLHWWDTYPVPPALPQPYNDQESWGIVPAWGFGVVTESTAEIPLGTLLWGFWPTASFPVSLRLQASGLKGSWTEISESRQRLMTIYNVYSEESHIDLHDTVLETKSWNDLLSLVDEDALRSLAWTSIFRPTWQTGYLLSRHTFTSDPASRPPIHPLGINLPWSATDADLSAAFVISLSASSKTGRSFAYHLLQRKAEEGPVGVLQVSQTPELLGLVQVQIGTQIPTKALRYDEVGGSVDWIHALKPRRIVIIDFGARAGTLVQLTENFETHSALKEVKTTIIQVGSEQKVYSGDEIKKHRESMQTMGKVQFNTSGVRDAVIAQTSAQDFHDHVQLVWDDWLRVSHEIMPDVQMKLCRGVSGGKGIEEGWRRLCQGCVDTQEGLAYVM